MNQNQASVHPFKQIWLHPRRVFSGLSTDSYDKYTYFLFITAGIARAFDRAIADSRGDELSLIEVSATVIVFGGALGWVSYYIFGLLLEWTGKWLNGKATQKQILNMLAYAMIPVTFGLLLLVVRLLIFGNEIFKSDGDLYDTTLFWRMVDRGALFGQWLLAMYALILVIIGISEVQKISIKKAIINFILPVVVVVVPLAFLIWLLIAPSL